MNWISLRLSPKQPNRNDLIRNMDVKYRSKAHTFLKGVGFFHVSQ